MKNRTWKIDAGSGVARSVLGCASPLPLSHPPGSHTRSPSARGLAHSKTWRSFVSSLVFLATALVAQAQNFAIDWFTLDGGGGTSTGGVYSVSGTIGQPDAGGAMTGGAFAVTGGFWVLPIGVPMPGMPTLIIVPFGPGQARLSWMPNTPGFVLQETLSLAPANWVNSPSGATNPTIVPATIPTKFYRLNKQ